MTEIIIRGLGIFLSGILWRMGGDEKYPKAIRRFGVPIIIVGINLIYQNWLSLISLPLLMGAYSLGYGESSTLTKWFKNKYIVRGICGLLYSLAGIPILWGNYWAMGYHILLVTSFVCLSGNQKFQYNDKREEMGIGMVNGLMVLL
jgi:hypothetical protein